MITEPPAAQHLGTAVLVQGRGVLDLHYLAALGARECRRDGIAPPRFAALLAVLAASASDVKASAAGHADVPSKRSSAESEVLEEIGTEGAARLLGLSRRQVRRVATALGGRRVAGGALVFDRGAVEAYRLERQTLDETKG